MLQETVVTQLNLVVQKVLEEPNNISVLNLSY